MSSNFIADQNFEVLIVEDEPILAMAMELKLKKMGLSVSAIATNPENAINYTQNLRPDIALIDINLNATQTGIDVANYIWKNFQIPIIYLTSYYNDKIINQAMEAEPYGYLIKPCRNEELKAAINTAMHKHQYFFKNKKFFHFTKKQIVYIERHIKFNRTTMELYVHNEPIKLTKNEKKLFDILSKESGKIIHFNTIFNFIWREDAYDLSKLRSLIYRFKTRTGLTPFENFYEEGYKLKTIKNKNEAI